MSTLEKEINSMQSYTLLVQQFTTTLSEATLKLKNNIFFEHFDAGKFIFLPVNRNFNRGDQS